MFEGAEVLGFISAPLFDLGIMKAEGVDEGYFGTVYVLMATCVFVRKNVSVWW